MAVIEETRGRVRVLWLANPPVNSLGHSTRLALARAVDAAEADAAIDAIVLAGTGAGFCAGADVREFNTPKALAEPRLPTLIGQLEHCSKPVVAALHGNVLGGGLELALGAHGRLATANASIGLPEVKLGLLPGAGGTQRLPRALGLEPALNMIVSGQPRKASALAEQGGQRLLDEVVAAAHEAPVAAACTLAEALAASGQRPRVRDASVVHPAAQPFLQFARGVLASTAGHLPAPARALECVARSTEAAGFEAGLAYEREAFLGLLATPEHRALRHAFFAPSAAAKVDGVPADLPLRPVARIGVLGGGTMGTGIAMSFLNAGLPVVLVEKDQAGLDRAAAAIDGVYVAQQKKGKLKPEQADERRSRLTLSLDDQAFAEADLLIEAVFEDMAVKEAVFRRFDAVARPGAILATNTSTLDVDQIAAATQRPQDVVGLHFFSPAHVMRLLEVVRGRATAPDVLATVLALAKKIGKTAVVSGVCDGFIGNRMVEQYLRQAFVLLEEGATPQQVDRAIERFGFAMGPFRMSDMAGNDIGWAIRKRRRIEKPEVRYSPIPDRLCEAGRFGQKTGAGWYDHIPGQRKPQPSAAVQQIIDAERQALGRTPRRIDDSEIVQRLVYALANEGARLIEEGIAARPGDVDVVYLAGYGFPAHRGGPMHYAAEQGWFNVARTMRGFARNPNDDAAFWQPAPLVERWAEGAGENASTPAPAAAARSAAASAEGARA